MVWKLDGQLMKSPSTYKINIEDLDNNSYTSKVNGALIDNVVAQGMLKVEMTFDLCTEAETETLIQATYNNPMNLTLKDPSIWGGIISAPFRCSKRTAEMIMTTNNENTSQSIYKVSFNLMQKELVSSQTI